MKRIDHWLLVAAITALLWFAVWTIAVRSFDVQQVGPEESFVGFATLNGWFHRLTGVSMVLYTITDWLGIVPLGAVFGFAVLGLCQWVSRRSLRKVDTQLLILGGYYVLVMCVYMLFEKLTVNFRPVLINGFLEKSYPSSTTLLVLSVMPTVYLQLRSYIHRRILSLAFASAVSVFMLFMVVGRLLAGVHWLSDIIGGVLLSLGLVLLYLYFRNILLRKEGLLHDKVPVKRSGQRTDKVGAENAEEEL